MNNHLISIIIPIYKCEPYIVRCIDSVLRQTYPNLELILVDDYSADNSIPLAKELICNNTYNNKINYTILRHDCRRGAAASRNTGIRAAKGDYIFFMDSDDEITEKCIEELATPIERFQYDIIIGDYTVVGSDNIYPSLKLDEGPIKNNEQIIKEYSSYNWYMMPWNKLLRADFLRKKNLFFNEEFMRLEDELWCFMIACSAQSMYAIKAKGYLYYIHENSIMTSLSIEERYMTMLKVLHCMYSYQMERHLVDINIENLIKWFIKRIYKESNRHSLKQFYYDIRKSDTRNMNIKRQIYSTYALRIKNYDLFVSPYWGYIYHYIYWQLMKIKTKNSYLPFIFW